MKGRDTPLHAATQAQLVEELARRLNLGDRTAPPESWCENCAHFRTTTPRALEMNPNWNPCAKRQKMKFYMPQDHDDPHTFGYYVDVCPFRTPTPELK